MDTLVQKFERNKKWLMFSVLAVFFWGLLAHMYCFVDNSFSHDSLNELHGAIFGSDWKIELGRVFVPLYRDLFRSDITLPWLIGVLSLLWIGLAVFFTVRIFHMESKLLVFLTAGIFTANISVSATAATYLHDLDCYMVSLLFAVAAVYLWNRSPWGFVPGAVLVAVSLGFYQAYVSVTIVLIMMVCILDLLNEKSFQYTFRRGLKAIGMILAGGILYYAAMRIVQRLSHIALATGEYNTLDKMLELTPRTFAQMTIGAYKDFFERLLNAYTTYPGVAVKAVTILLLAFSAAAVAMGLWNKKVHLPEKLLCIVLIGLLPLGMNLLYVLTLGGNHDLMVYAIWMSYLLVLLLGDWLVRKWKDAGYSVKRIKAGGVMNGFCMLLVLFLLYGSVQFSNGMYLKKDLEYDAYLSLMTRVVYRMEDYDGYVPEQTPVCFVGLPQNLNKVIPGFKEFRNVTGMISTDVIYQPTRDRFQAYFDYVLGTPVLLADQEIWVAMWTDPRAAEMPSYPADGCMAMLDDILVVKLG